MSVNFLWRQEIVDSTIFLEFLLFLCCFYAYSYQYDICNARPLKILLHYCTLFELLRLDRYSCRKLWILWKWILLNLWTSSQSYNSNIRRYDIHHFCVRQGRMSNNEIVFCFDLRQKLLSDIIIYYHRVHTKLVDLFFSEEYFQKKIQRDHFNGSTSSSFPTDAFMNNY